MTMLADRGSDTIAPSSFDLSRLIHPVDVATFQREYWEREPLLVQRDDPGYYRDLLTLDDIDRLLTLSGASLDHIRVVIDGNETPVSRLSATSGSNALEALFEKYRSGSTVVLNSLDGRFEPLQRLSHALTDEVNARFQMNIYVTPAGNRGFKPHYDMHDVFVAQVHGSKRWKLARQPLELPLNGQPYDKSQPEPEPSMEFELRPGDMVYLPRGTIHSAESNDTVSVHITIGMHPVLWSDLIDRAVKKLHVEDVRFRRALPMGFLNDAELRDEVVATATELLDALRAEISPRAVADDAIKLAASIGRPTLRHHLTDLEELGRVGLDTRVRRRAEQQWDITLDDGMVELGFHDKTVKFPAHVADELRYVAENGAEGIAGRDIPGYLDEPGRIVLITTLVREGFLTLA